MDILDANFNGHFYSVFQIENNYPFFIKNSQLLNIPSFANLALLSM